MATEHSTFNIQHSISNGERVENADGFALPLKALADLIEEGDWEMAGALASGIAAKCNRQAKGCNDVERIGS